MFLILIFVVTDMRCEAHILHLAIATALKAFYKEFGDEENKKSLSFKDVVERWRSVVKELRTQICLPYIIAEKLPKPALDCPTR